MPPTIVGTELENTSCCACGVAFAVPVDLLTNRRELGTAFHCPNGHALVYKSENERLRREKAEMQEKYFAEQRKAEALERSMTKLKKRVAKGVCPCCQRSFTNLQRHMHTKHPEFPVEAKS